MDHGIKTMNPSRNMKRIRNKVFGVISPNMLLLLPTYVSVSLVDRIFYIFKPFLRLSLMVETKNWTASLRPKIHLVLELR